MTSAERFVSTNGIHGVPSRLTPAQFASRFEESAQSLWCIALAILRDHTLAEDTLQDAAVIGLRNLDAFEPGTAFSAWMGQIVRNCARNMLRRRIKDPSRMPEEEPPPRSNQLLDRSPLVSANGRFAHDQDAFDDRVVATLDTLTETARACLLMRTVVGASYREISTVLGIPEGTVMSHVHRARAAMRAALR